MEELDLVNISTAELIAIYKMINDFLNKIDQEIKSLEGKTNAK